MKILKMALFIMLFFMCSCTHIIRDVNKFKTNNKCEKVIVKNFKSGIPICEITDTKEIKQIYSFLKFGKTDVGNPGGYSLDFIFENGSKALITLNKSAWYLSHDQGFELDVKIFDLIRKKYIK